MERKKKLLLPFQDLAKTNVLKITSIECIGCDPAFIQGASLFFSRGQPNFLFILNQGEKELECLQAMILDSIKYIYTSIYPHNLNRMDNYLKKLGFNREETIMTVESYGEAFFSRG